MYQVSLVISAGANANEKQLTKGIIFLSFACAIPTPRSTVSDLNMTMSKETPLRHADADLYIEDNS